MYGTRRCVFAGWATFLWIGIGVSLAGCQSNSDLDPGRAEGVEGARDAAASFLQRVARDDPGAVCALMTPDAQDALVARVGGQTCLGAARVVSDASGGASLKVLDVVLRDDGNALADTSLTGKIAKFLDAPDGTLVLVRNEARWQVSRLIAIQGVVGV